MINILIKAVQYRVFRPAILLMALSLSGQAMAQTTLTSSQHYDIEDFSDDYSATIRLKALDADDSESNVIVDIKDKTTGQVIFSQPASIDIEYELDNGKDLQLDGKISANIVSFPYGEHSVLIYDDFNFDKQKDLALRDGRNGCYGGPSYQVYLKDGDSFVHSESFTELAQGNCGFFGIDEEAQTLSTMTKSGAAWHQYSEYKVIDNQAVAVRIVEEEYNSKGLISITEKTRVNGKMQVDNYEVLIPYSSSNEDKTLPFVYRFDLDNGKQMVLDSLNDGDTEQLYYTFADENNRVELYYDGPFIYDAEQKTLSFVNRPVVYQINKQGITVRQSNKTTLLKSQLASVMGSLDNLGQFGNVSIR